MQEHIQNCYRLYDITQYSLEFHIVSTMLYIHSFGILIKNNYLIMNKRNAFRIVPHYLTDQHACVHFIKIYNIILHHQ